MVLIHPLADPGDKSLGPARPGPSGTRDPSPAPPPPKWTGSPPPCPPAPAGVTLGPCCPHSSDHPGPASLLRKTGLSAHPTQWAWVRKQLQQGSPREQVGPGDRLFLEAHSPGKSCSNHRDNKLRRSPLQPAKPALHKPAASLGGGGSPCLGPQGGEWATNRWEGSPLRRRFKAHEEVGGPCGGYLQFNQTNPS